jgi:hypothetical protein
MMPPLGWKKIRPGPGEFLDAEQIQLLAELAVVALLRFFKLVEVLVELLLREPGGAVNALQLLVLLVALPVGAGDREQLERLELRGVGTCGPRQKSMKCGPSVYSEKMSSAFSSMSSTFIGSSMARYLARPSGFGDQLPVVGEVLRLQLPHLRLDLFQILGVNGSGRSKS